LIEGKAIFVICLLVVAVLSDIDRYKISNKLIIGGILLGMIVSFYEYGIKGVLSSISAICVTLGILLILFIVRVLGAGDIKLFAVVGSFYGCRFIIKCIAISFVIGGIMSIYKMVSQKELRKRVKHLKNYIIDRMIYLNIEAFESISDRYEDNTINFSIAILIGYFIALFTV